jgi:hypothetical protein
MTTRYYFGRVIAFVLSILIMAHLTWFKASIYFAPTLEGSGPL